MKHRLCAPSRSTYSKRRKPGLLTLISNRLIQSDLFTFQAGKNEKKKDILVHSKAIAATSPYFNALVNNGMTESHKRVAEYPDMEPEDLARFVEYAYHHDYTVPSWVRDEAPVPDTPPPAPDDIAEEAYPEPVPESFEAQYDDFGTPIRRVPLMSKKKGFKGSKKTAYEAPYQLPNASALRAGFEKRSYYTSNHPKEAMLAAFEPQCNTAPDQDFRPVLLAHARLYNFARMYLVDPLKSLTLHKLHRTLLSFQLYERRVGDIVQLARYAYKGDEEDETHGNGTMAELETQQSDALDELRQLVLEYMVLNVTTFGKDPSFITLLQEGGEFVVDFWDILYKEKLQR